MTTLPATGFDTAQDLFAGAWTKSFANARWIKWSIVKVNHSHCCSEASPKRFIAQKNWFKQCPARKI